jgi:signal transduction histidine kinase
MPWPENWASIFLPILIQKVFRKLMVSFKNKIMAGILGVIIFFSLTTLFVTHGIFLHVLKKAFQEKGIAVAKSMAIHSITGVLTLNNIRLKEAIGSEMKSNKDITYFFILDSRNEILAHTFENGFPVELLSANSLLPGKSYVIQTIDIGGELIEDIAVPIKVEESIIGTVRMGMSQNSIKKTVGAINNLFITVTLILLSLGVLLAYRISYLITRPIKRLVEASKHVHRGEFEAEIEAYTNDEIGFLTQTFNEMVRHLREQIEEIKRLTVVEERNRIAIELHDGLAQNLFQLTTGLEYCEKIFQKDPLKAYDEMAVLKEHSRSLLQDAREVIFDLRAAETEDGHIWLTHQITDFINNFQKRLRLPVKVEMSTFKTRLPLIKAKVLFYIIKEAFSNIERHSHSQNIEALITNSGNNLNIMVKDDGQGFEVEKVLDNYCLVGKFGLAGMKQRVSSIGGELFIDSKPSEGTKIFIRVPLEDER